MRGDGDGLVHPLANRVPALRRALDEDWVARQARLFTVGEVEPSDVRTGWVWYRADGTVTLRYLLGLGQGPARSPDRTLLVDIPRDAGLPAVRPFPQDPRLPTLPRAVDPASAVAVLRRTVPGVGGERGLARCSVDVVHHPREGACVLRYELHPGAGGAGELRHRTVYAKVHPDPGAAGTATAALRQLTAGPARDGRAPVRIPRPLGHDPVLHLALIEAIPGTPALPQLLTAALRDGGVTQGLREGISAAGVALAALHRRPLPAGSALPAYAFADEARLLGGELAVVRAVWPAVAERVARSLTAALAGVCAPPAGGPVVSHGDFTPAQVLLAPSGPGVVDLDTIRLAEPAADVGRFLAYLDALAVRRAGTGARPLLGALAECFLAAYAAEGAPSTVALRRRAAAYRATSLARMAMRACRQLKDTRLETALALLDRADLSTGVSR